MTLAWVPRRKVVSFIKMGPPEKEQCVRKDGKLSFRYIFAINFLKLLEGDGNYTNLCTIISSFLPSANTIIF